MFDMVDELEDINKIYKICATVILLEYRRVILDSGASKGTICNSDVAHGIRDAEDDDVLHMSSTCSPILVTDTSMRLDSKCSSYNGSLSLFVLKLWSCNHVSFLDGRSS